MTSWGSRIRNLFKVPPLSSRQWRILGVLGAANLIDSYDLAILGLALPQIQRGLEITEESVGGVTAFIRLGVIPSLALTLFADRFGRRRLLLVTILGFTLGTFATAFAQSPAQFQVLQLVARMFIAAEGLLAVVVIVEELSARHRGWGIGVLGALGALGHGLAAIIFAMIGVLPYGWRSLYVLGIIPLLTIAWFRRTLEETHRFRRHLEERAPDATPWAALQPLRSLMVMYPGRLLALCGALFPVSLMSETAMVFVSKHLQEVHHYEPRHVFYMYITIGLTALAGNIMAGSLGDQFGRKRTMFVALVINALAVAGFYNLSGPLVPVAWGLMVLTLTMVFVLFGALGGELFPTSYRSTASGVRAVVATLGAALGLWLEGKLYTITGTHAGAITAMLVAAPVAPLIIMLFLPETARQELEEISPEKPE